MRTLAITQNITVDGSIEMLGKWFDPKEQAANEPLLAEIQRQTEKEDALLLGRKTFEAFRSYWPKQSDDKTGVSKQLDAVKKYVVSSTITDPAWKNSEILGADWVERVRALKAQPGKEIIATGSIALCHALISTDLVDEYRLFAYPVVQGRGRRLFPDGFETSPLRLVESKPLGNVVLSIYAR